MMEWQAATIDEHLHETKITNKKKESYKTTELGLIPESWKIVKFENVLNLFNGYAFKSADAVESSKTQLIRMGNLYQNKLDLERKPIFYPDSYEQKYSKYVLQEGDLIISLTGTSEKEDYGFTVKINKTNKKLLLNQRVARIDIISADVNRDYIFYFLLSRIFLTPLFLTAKGMKQANLSTNAIKKLNVVIPPLEEQRKIARVLLLVQDAIAQQEQLITLTTELKKTLMQKLFTEGTDWDVVPLEKTGEVIYGIQASVANNIEPLGTKILTNKNININGEFNFEKQNYFEITTERHRKTILKKGDILFNWRSGSKEHVGKTAYFDLDGEYTHSSFILRIRPYSNVNGRYIFHYLTWLRESNYFVKLQSYAINAKFNKSAVDALPTLLPTPENQDNIAFSLDLLSDKVNQHRAKRNILNDLFRTLLHQLMTAQIRVDDLNLSALNLELQGGDE